jgi:hypothetical protein
MKLSMKQACELVKANRIAAAKKHRKEVTQGELCSGLTDKEWNKVQTKVKGAGSRGRKHAHTALWNYHNSGVQYKINTKKAR